MGGESPQTPLLMMHGFLQNKQKHPISAWKPLGNNLETPEDPLPNVSDYDPSHQPQFVVIDSGSDEKYCMKSKKLTFFQCITKYGH